MNWKRQSGGTYLSDRGYMVYRWQTDGKWMMAYPGEFQGKPSLLQANLPFDTVEQAKAGAEDTWAKVSKANRYWK